MVHISVNSFVSIIVTTVRRKCVSLSTGPILHQMWQCRVIWGGPVMSRDSGCVYQGSGVDSQTWLKHASTRLSSSGHIDLP